MSNEIMIFDWVASPPKSLTLFRYERNTNYKNILQVSSDNYSKELRHNVENKTPTLLVRFSDYLPLGMPIKNDYKLVIDEKIEVIFSNVQNSRPNTGCQIMSGKANQCEIDFGGSRLSTDMKCLSVK
ncbi:hypothetical protein [Janthinobacterium sp. B9-8]|uniref:hypothetical protein n=1 Tax=Janthinobacterium sp. B9-8 TaxID=1236179 RepID=UPI0012E38B19|nr:hypothetical protein [Janthinobacterium sp. B9-8]